MTINDSGTTFWSPITFRNGATFSGPQAPYTKTEMADTINRATIATPLYSGFISSIGTINNSSGYYTFTVGKSVTGQYAINFGTALSSSNYTVLVTLRVSTASMSSYSNQPTIGFTIFTFNSSGVATDIGFSFRVILS